ncbi:MAG: MBL fold metallo-hydrolase [Lachnospiraceae bacterium]|nr:MBL fold metallo-hydrolase [Lachnospiraceae bacterium]
MDIGGYRLYRYILPLLNSNMFIILSGHSALIIDPIDDEEALQLLEREGVDTITAILTHEHYDHICGVNALRDLMDRCKGGIKVYANSCCAAAVREPDSNLSRFFLALFITRSDEDRMLAEKIFDMDYSCSADISFEGDMELGWEELKLRLHSTPGHSPGSICAEIYDRDGKLTALATGDSLVEGNSVITRLPNGSRSDYRNITRPYLESFGPDITVLPGHGEISPMDGLELG